MPPPSLMASEKRLCCTPTTVTFCSPPQQRRATEAGEADHCQADAWCLCSAALWLMAWGATTMLLCTTGYPVGAGNAQDPDVSRDPLPFISGVFR